MTKTINTLSLIFDRLTAVCVLLFLAGMPTLARAQYYYSEYYYANDYDYTEYYSYESNVQDAFAAQNPTASSPSQIRGRQNIWEDEYDDDENLHPGDPLPLGDHTILFVLAAITAMSIFIQQRKRRQSSSAKTLLTTLAFICITSPLLAQSSDDLRVKYIEHQLERYQDNHQWKTRINRIYTFESEDVFSLAEGESRTVSVHIFNKIEGGKDHVNHPAIILQRHNGSEWEDIEAHMIFGPLKGDAGMGLLPGRKNASVDSPVDDWVIQDGIENIKNDLTYADKGYRASGVWNFVVTKKDGKATFDMDQVKRCDGPFYVRVNGDTGYEDDKNLVTLSEYALEHIYEEPIGALKPHDYTHYACKNLPKDASVKFTIATEHSSRIAPDYKVEYQRYTTDDKATDIYVYSDATLPAAASVRFSWDIMTNRLTRAYIAETKPKLGNEYLVIEGDITPTDAQFPGYFYDNTNWVYSTDLQIKPGALATVRAKYNGSNQYFWNNKAFLDGSSSTAYPVRIIYDFKEHRFSTIYSPNSEITGEINLNTPVMILREHNDPATQIIFNSNADKVVANGDGEYEYDYPAYGVLTFLEDKFAVTDQYGNDNTTTNHYEKMFYWVSFPFNVKIDEVVGLGEYEGYWAVQYYNGPKRALQGLPDGTTGWEYVQKGETLQANVGYVVCLNYRRLTKDYGFTAGEGRKLSLYFPSASKVSPADIKDRADITVTLDEHPRGEKVAWNHWNWHLLGVPSYANPDFRTTQGDVPFFYQYWHPTDGYAAVASTEVDFYAMHSYMVQYAGEIEWSKIVNTAPSGLAAKKNSSAIDKTMLRIELQQVGETLDKTYVQLRDEEGTEGFDLNLDLTKIINKGANIYTVVHGDQMAGNVVPAQESMIPLGVVIAEAGDYTFAMPEGTSGTQVELIDYETGISTPLAAMDYTVNMPAGSFDNRFALSIKPDKVTTGVDNLGDEATGDKAKKYLIDGALYLVKDGVMYDAQGRCVQKHAIRSGIAL